MKKGVCLLGVLIFLCSSPSYGQKKWNWELKPLVYIEKEKIFSKKNSPSYDAKFNVGLGLLVCSTKYLKLGSSNILGYGNLQLGQVYFWDNKLKGIGSNFPYIENNLVSPILVGFGGTNFNSTSSLEMGKYIFLDLFFGKSYVQNVKRNVLTNDSRANKYWANQLGGKIYLHIIRNKTKFFSRFGLGFEYTNLAGRHILGLFYVGRI